MFTENFNDTASSRMSFRIPLKIAISMFKYRIQFIAHQFIRGKYPNAFGIIDEDLIDKCANDGHTRCFCPAFSCEFLPICDLKRSEPSVCLLTLTNAEFRVLRENTGDDIFDRAIFIEELFVFVGGEPLIQKLELGIVCPCSRKRDLVGME